MRKVGIEIVGNAASAVRSFAKTGEAAALMGKELRGVGVEATTSAEKTVRAAIVSRDAILKQITAVDALTASYARGSREQMAAANLGARLRGQLGRNLATGETEALTRRQRIERMAGGARTVGRGLSTFVTAPAAFGAFEAVKSSVGFSRQMLLLQTQAGASAREVKQLNGEVLKLAQSAPQGPIELAKGLYHLESLGLHGAVAMKTLRTSALAAGMGIADLETVTTALGAAVVTGIRGTQNYGQAMGLLNATVGAGNMRMEDLTGALSTGILPAAKNAGLSLDQVGAALATLTDRGMGADEAATRLRMTFALMQHHSSTAQKALKDLGIGPDELAITLRKPNGLLQVLQMLHDRMKNVGAVRGSKDILAAFGGGRSGAGILTLVQSLDSGLSSYQAKLDQVRGGQKKFADDVQTYMQSPAYKLATAWSSVQVAFVRLGGALAPAAVAAATAIGKIATAFSALPTFAKRGLGVIIGILAIGGPLLVGAAAMVGAITRIKLAFTGIGPAAVRAEVQTAGAMAGMEASTAAASSEVGLLRGSLLGLGALAIAPIVIPIEYNFAKSKYNPLGGPMRALGAKLAGGGQESPQQKSAELHSRQELAAATQMLANGASDNQVGAMLYKRFGIRETAVAKGILAGAHHKLLEGATRGAGPHHGGPAPVSAAAATDRGGAAHAGASRPALLQNLVVPFALRKEAASAMNQSQDMKAARDELAWLSRTIDSGRLAPKALLEALQMRRQLTDEVASVEASQRKQTTKIAKAAKKAIDKSRGFSLPQSMQVAEARADALAAADPNHQGPTAAQMALAKQVKAAATKAINSHKLSFQGLIDAWNAVGQANATLAQKASMTDTTKTYKLVSLNALTSGLNLAGATKKLIQERAAQAQAHGGTRPTGPAAQGQIVHIHGDVHLTGPVHNIDELYGKLGKVARKRRVTR